MELKLLQDVSMRFGDTSVLKNVNLQIAKGECVVLIGPKRQKAKPSCSSSLAGLLEPTNRPSFCRRPGSCTLFEFHGARKTFCSIWAC